MVLPVAEQELEFLDRFLAGLALVDAPLAEDLEEAQTDAQDFRARLVEGLAAGSHRLMIVVDSGLSRANGFGWEDTFPTEETAWGGVVSELRELVSPRHLYL